MKVLLTRLRACCTNYGNHWRSNPLAAAFQHLRYFAVACVVGVAATIAMYYHGIPYIRYAGETLAGQQTLWAEPTELTAGSYCSFAGRLDVVANEYSEGCGVLIWVPIDHIEGLDQKLPFSILRAADDWFRTEPATNTRQKL